jgi:hypothetical protein
MYLQHKCLRNFYCLFKNNNEHELPNSHALDNTRTQTQSKQPAHIPNMYQKTQRRESRKSKSISCEQLPVPVSMTADPMRPNTWARPVIGSIDHSTTSRPFYSPDIRRGPWRGGGALLRDCGRSNTLQQKQLFLRLTDACFEKKWTKSIYFKKSHKLSETFLPTTYVVQATTGITDDRNI